jgi:hypothetical protein
MKRMTTAQAKKILGDRSKWELKNIVRTLSMFRAFNSPEENERLEAAKVILKLRGKK